MQDLLIEVLQTEQDRHAITHSVEEAYLSDRIVVMTAQPARIREIVVVPFGHREESLHDNPSSSTCGSRTRLVMQEYAAQAAGNTASD
jgi:ABC-type nitrate/sulfonate/bicarbonate transport system ATPase subunit